MSICRIYLLTRYWGGDKPARNQVVYHVIYSSRSEVFDTGLFSLLSYRPAGTV